MKKSRDEGDFSSTQGNCCEQISATRKFPLGEQDEGEDTGKQIVGTTGVGNIEEDLLENDKSDVTQTFAGIHNLHVAFNLSHSTHSKERQLSCDVDQWKSLESDSSTLKQAEETLLKSLSLENDAIHRKNNNLKPYRGEVRDSSNSLTSCESTELPLIQSPLVTTPPYEYLILPQGHESKFRIYLNPRVNETFHQSLLKQLNPFKDDVDTSLPPSTIPSLAFPQPLPSSSAGPIVSCFDPSELDMELKQLLLLHPPVTNTFVLKRSRKERGSSVPAIDSYYGCEDLDKVGHASYFIPLLTPSERKALGWKDDYKYGKWKYSSPNIPKIIAGHIPLASGHSTILAKASSSWWKRTTNNKGPQDSPASGCPQLQNQSDASIVPFMKAAKDAMLDEGDEPGVENASVATLAGSAANPPLQTSSGHMKRRLHLSRLLRWLVPHCLKSRETSSIQTWEEGDPSFPGSLKTSASSMMEQLKQDASSSTSGLSPVDEVVEGGDIKETEFQDLKTSKGSSLKEGETLDKDNNAQEVQEDPKTTNEDRIVEISSGTKAVASPFGKRGSADSSDTNMNEQPDTKMAKLEPREISSDPTPSGEPSDCYASPPDISFVKEFQYMPHIDLPFIQKRPLLHTDIPEEHGRPEINIPFIEERCLLPVDLPFIQEVQDEVSISPSDGLYIDERPGAPGPVDVPFVEEPQPGPSTRTPVTPEAISRRDVLPLFILNSAEFLANFGVSPGTPAWTKIGNEHGLLRIGEAGWKVYGFPVTDSNTRRDSHLPPNLSIESLLPPGVTLQDLGYEAVFVPPEYSNDYEEQVREDQETENNYFYYPNQPRMECCDQNARFLDHNQRPETRFLDAKDTEYDFQLAKHMQIQMIEEAEGLTTDYPDYPPNLPQPPSYDDDDDDDDDEEDDDDDEVHGNDGNGTESEEEYDGNESAEDYAAAVGPQIPNFFPIFQNAAVDILDKSSATCSNVPSGPYYTRRTLRLPSPSSSQPPSNEPESQDDAEVGEGFRVPDSSGAKEDEGNNN